MTPEVIPKAERCRQELQVLLARLDPAFVAGIRRGLKARREGRLVPWDSKGGESHAYRASIY